MWVTNIFKILSFQSRKVASLSIYSNHLKFFIKNVYSFLHRNFAHLLWSLFDYLIFLMLQKIIFLKFCLLMVLIQLNFLYWPPCLLHRHGVRESMSLLVVLSLWSHGWPYSLLLPMCEAICTEHCQLGKLTWVSVSRICIWWDNHILLFYSVNVEDYTDWYFNVKKVFIDEINTTWSWCILFMYSYMLVHSLCFFPFHSWIKFC